MPASTLPVSTWVSTDFTSGCRVTGFTVIPTFLNTPAATTPHGTCGWHSATLTDFFARSFTDVTFAGLFGGTATSMMFLAKFCGLDASPAETTSCMVLGDAEAKMSAGAPLVIWASRPELGPKLNFTVSPLCAASNCFPSWVNAPVSDEAANTVIVPVAGAELPVLGVELELLLEQPAAATATKPAAIRAKRRILTPWSILASRVSRPWESRPRRWWLSRKQRRAPPAPGQVRPRPRGSAAIRTCAAPPEAPLVPLRCPGQPG